MNQPLRVNLFLAWAIMGLASWVIVGLFVLGLYAIWTWVT